MIAWAGDNMVSEIPGMWGTCGDETDAVAGRDRDGDAVLYFTQDADRNPVGLGDAASGAENGTGTIFRPGLASLVSGRAGYLVRHKARAREAKNGASPGLPAGRQVPALPGTAGRCPRYQEPQAEA